MRACSVEIRAAPVWSSQKPGAPIASSSSSRRRARPSGSKVITDPGELGPDLLEALIEALRRLGHAPKRSRAVRRSEITRLDPTDGRGVYLRQRDRKGDS